MKLWQKISALCVCVLLAVVVVCGALLLAYARDSILSPTIEQARLRQSNMITSFTDMAQYYLQGDTYPLYKTSGLQYFFGRYADASSVLEQDGETLYSSVAIDPKDYMTLPQVDDVHSPSEPQVVLKTISGRNVLIVGSSVAILGDEYEVYTVKDITDVYGDIAAMIWRFVVICAAGIVAGTVLIVLIVLGATRSLTVLKNITRRIAAGEYGQRADIQTRDEAGELAADFNDMAEAIQSHIARLNDTAQRQQLFIGGLTHELKTPIASMMLHTDTLLTADLTADEAKASLTHMHEQCRWLERLSQKLLMLITLEQELKVQPKNIRLLLDDVRGDTAETLRERDTPLIVECDTETIAMDYDLMKSLLINLVDNASKASAQGQEIRLSAYGNTIEVSDRGSGIPPEDVARVTDAFFMVDRSRSRKAAGSGLGLALAKRIADAHGAELLIGSEPLVGTTVKVVFPEGLAR